MSDWRKQSEEMMKFFTQSQREMWDAWTKAATKSGATAPVEMWDQAMGAWKEAVRRSLNAQSEWAQLWADSVRSTMNLPKDSTNWADQMLNTMKSATEAQAKMWEQWVETLRGAAPNTLVQQMNETSQAAFKTWQESVERTIAAQQDFIKTLMGQK